MSCLSLDRFATVCQVCQHGVMSEWNSAGFSPAFVPGSRQDFCAPLVLPRPVMCSKVQTQPCSALKITTHTCLQLPMLSIHHALLPGSITLLRWQFCPGKGQAHHMQQEKLLHGHPILRTTQRCIFVWHLARVIASLQVTWKARQMGGFHQTN